MMSKEAIVRLIADGIGVEAPKMSTGSTEPRRIFDLVNEVLGLGIDQKCTKPEMARQIVEAAGLVWAPDYESRGGTVTRNGLAAVLRAVERFLG